MTTALSSSQKCDVCRSSGSNCCGHDCTYRLITRMPHVSSHDHDHINPAAAPFRSPTSSRNPPLHEASHEFHFFGNDDNTITWLLDDINSSRRSGHDDEAAAPVVLAPPPTVNYSTHHQHRPHNYCNPWRLTLDICSSTASSTGSPSRSTPSVDVSAIGQAASSALPMSFSGSTLTDASTGNFKEVGNAMNISGGMNNPLTEREARVLRYKEKKKNRMFDNQIRYPSRKAYAGQRPRIRGRFAKRPEAAEPTAPS